MEEARMLRQYNILGNSAAPFGSRSYKVPRLQIEAILRKHTADIQSLVQSPEANFLLLR